MTWWRIVLVLVIVAAVAAGIARERYLRRRRWRRDLERAARYGERYDEDRRP